MKTAKDYLLPFVGAEPTNFITYADAMKAVQAVIDHYDPLPGKLELAYRVVEHPAAPMLANVFPPACPRCLQRGAECLCPPMFPREEPPF
jgi:hypothetical protein